jgi:hypothetical protein
LPHEWMVAMGVRISALGLKVQISD